MYSLIKSRCRGSRVGVEACWLLAANGVTFIVSLVALRALTASIPPAEYGQIALASSAVMLANQVVFAPLSNAASRFYSISQEKDACAQYYVGLLHLCGRCAALPVAVFLAALPFLYARQGSVSILALGTFLWAIAAGLNSVLDAIQNAARHRIVVAIHQTAAQVLRLLFAIVLVSCAHGSAKPGLAMLGFAGGAAVVLVSQVLVLRRWELDRVAWRGVASNAITAQMAAFAAPFVIWGLFTWLQQYFDRWVLQIAVSSHDLGVYQSASQIGVAPITNLFAVGMQLITPIAYSLAGDNSSTERLVASHSLINKAALAGIVVTISSCAAAMLCRKVLAHVLLAPAYREGSWMIPGFVLSAGIFGVGQVLSIKLMTNGSTNSLLAPKIGSALIGCSLVVLMSRWMGVSGVLVAQIITSVGYTLWMCALSQKQPNPVYPRESYDNTRQNEIAPEAAR